MENLPIGRIAAFITIGKLVILLKIVNAIYILKHMNKIRRELCPGVEAAFAFLATKWTALVLFSLIEGELRFSELEAAITGLSSRLLSLRMHELEESGLVERHVYAEESPIKVGYRLTERGSSLAAILGEIADWAKN